ncbi:PKS-NRPS hybrid synthetase CHGG_01239,Fusaridione A synthetase fsdS,Highly reducing polyketide synthase NEC1,Highly reducing polyketide synthase AFT9-1,Highly reducing polyketide synthase curS1,Highly reducing polyketide synthase ctvA,Highly reducing polyketide synthase Dhc3 [Mytilus edulis]|uniref:Polyketide synthase n=1 Tax=Mytilus edulis TaxID=6550 RepID=A0A8S3UNL4_MYTED|nr:PKS-NRPS hybrid synthetase CHGG_01239,Fusaridione A synthetase fsdS,Highly reducing polyketide synthase NEC1,Highly reducing polyketide synthase AFT9-1,Highly reducing polyketide synthase curS1,Highly reducing polyketide synthase ctvA,Highly reducing polyketide synthase Dhc3 [Mytilus edulis]
MDDDDAIAVVGIGGKFPGADNTKEFWEVLKNGENHVKEIPPDRWNLDAFYSNDPDSAGKTYVHRAGFLKKRSYPVAHLHSIKLSTTNYFQLVTPKLREWTPTTLCAGMCTYGIRGRWNHKEYGFMNSDYKEACTDDLAAMSNYTLTGSSSSILSARVSYVYNLLGPSMAIDTACSSALVAVDVAIQSLKTGRCPIAICGGVSSILSPDLFVALSRARMVSPTGQCQAFSENADGYARGEGCGIVILKRLADAKRDSNKIWATIATDCNQDGSTASPITAPSSSQQESLLRRVYSNHNVDPQDVQVIEAHGTGTPVGDPIEANALGNFFGHNDQQQVYIASVKTNIGHLESAAGAAGLIKVLLMMKHQTIVPSLHFNKDHFNYRVAFYAETINDLKVKIRNREKSPEQIIKANLTPPKVIAVFCGVGTTWRGMCKQLMTANSVVQDVIRKIDSILSKWLEWSIYDILISSKDISSPMVAHISIFTCQVAIWTLWRHFGLKVDAVIGQSVGEVAAAYAVDYIESVCSQFQGKACIAVYNSSTSCTVSCDSDITGALKSTIRNGLPSEHRETFFEKDLDVQCAYHSHHTEQAGNDLQQALGNLNRPKPVLRTHLKDSYTEEEAISLPSMKEKSEENTLSDSICKCFESGLNLNWNVVSKENGKLCDLPKYSFNPTQKCLFQSDTTLLKRQGLDKNLGSHLFVERTPDSTSTFRVTISEKTTPFVFEHCVSNSIVVPGAFYVEVALEVAHICTEKRVQDIAVAVEFVRPIVLTMGKTYTTDVTVFSSVPGSPSGILKKGKEVISNFRCHVLNNHTNIERIDLQHIRQDCDKFQKSEDVYKTLNKLGFSYGEGLQILGDSYNNSTQSLVDINVSDLIWKDIKRTNFHPSILDAMFQTLGILQTDDMEDRVVYRRGLAFSV